MREIKFRAWDENNLRFLSMPLVGLDFENNCIQSYEVEQVSDTEYVQVQNVCYSYTLMQYTGLKDKNGVEIYEGDIVKEHFGAIAQVEFRNGCFVLDLLDDKPRSLASFIMADFGNKTEVIGNIYENPELLKDK